MTLVATHALVGSPPLDDEVPIQASQHDLADLDPELSTGFDASGVDFGRSSRDLCLSRPSTRVILGRIDAVTVDGEARIPAQVVAATSSRHHAEAQLTVFELDLGATDAGRTVLTDRGHDVMLVRGE